MRCGSVEARKLLAMNQANWQTRYGIALAIVAVSVGLLFLPAFSGLGHILYLVVLVIAWQGGLGPGLLSVGLFSAASLYGMVHYGVPVTRARVVALSLFVAGAAMIPVLVEALHASR